jgi:hypothetical protein
MTCDECLLLMEDDLDAELDGRTASLLAAHLAGCSSCAKEYCTLCREREIYAQYSRDVEVPPALWAAVRTRLERDLKSPRFTLWRSLRQWVAAVIVVPRFTPMLTASLILVAIGMTAVVMRIVNLRQNEAKGGVSSQEAKRDDRQPFQPAIPTPGSTPERGAAKLEAQPPTSQGLSIREFKSQVESSSGVPRKKAAVAPRGRQAPTVEELVAQAEQKYLAAIAILSRDVKKRDTKLEPVLRARFEETLVAIDRTIADTRQAVGQRPTDPEAVRYMLTAYAKKVEVLQEMASY